MRFPLVPTVTTSSPEETKLTNFQTRSISTPFHDERPINKSEPKKKERYQTQSPIKNSHLLTSTHIKISLLVANINNNIQKYNPCSVWKISREEREVGHRDREDNPSHSGKRIRGSVGPDDSVDPGTYTCYVLGGGHAVWKERGV